MFVIAWKRDSRMERTGAVPVVDNSCRSDASSHSHCPKLRQPKRGGGGDEVGSNCPAKRCTPAFAGCPLPRAMGTTHCVSHSPSRPSHHFIPTVATEGLLRCHRPAPASIVR